MADESSSSETTDIVTGLTTTGTADFGKSLVEAAQKANRDALQGAVVGRVQEFLMQLKKQRDYMAQTEKNIALLEAKVAAVKDGQFHLSPYGVITFTDKKLDAGVVRMAECTNCGYGGRKDIDSVPPGRSR